LKLSDADIKKRLDAVKAEFEINMKKADTRWVEAYDPAAEEFYYWNTETQEVVWDKPDTYITSADDETMSAVIRIQCLWRTNRARSNFSVRRKRQNRWVETVDEGSGKSYYYNTETHGVQWEKPIEFLAGAKTDDELQESLKRAFEGKLRIKNKVLDDQVKTAQEKLQQDLATAAAISENVWVAVYDSEKDGYYYWERNTNKTTWDKPEYFIASADDETMRSVIEIQNVYRCRKARQKVRQVALDSGKYGQEDLDLMFELEDTDKSAVTWKGKARHGARAKQQLIHTSDEQFSEATQRIAHLNDEESKMRLEMEELRRKKALAERLSREREAALELERAKQEGEQKERMRLLRIQEKKARRDERLRRKRESKIAENTERLEAKRKVLEDNEQRRLQKEGKLKQDAEGKIVREKMERDAWLKARKDKRIDQEQQRIVDIKAWKALLVEFRQTMEQEELAFSKWATERNATYQHMFQQRKDDILKYQELKRVTILSRGPWEAAAYSCCSASECGELLTQELKPASQKNEVGDTYLHVACWHGDAEKVQLLLSNYNADPNALDSVSSRMTPLHEAARGGHLEVVQLLLDSGARIDACNIDVDTPLHVATRGMHHRVCKALLLADKEKLTTWTMKNARGHTAMGILRNERRGGDRYGNLDRLFGQVQERVEQIRLANEEKQRKTDFENKTYRNKQSRALKGLRQQVKGKMHIASKGVEWGK
jgi:hypothetical protein